MNPSSVLPSDHCHPGNNNPAPAIISLDGRWSFTYQPDALPDDSTSISPPGQFPSRMPVPARWDDHSDAFAPFSSTVKTNPAYKPVAYPFPDAPPDTALPHIIGTGWYSRNLEIPTQWSGKSIILHVAGAMLDVAIFCNGTFVSRHFGYSTPFTVDLTSHLRIGQPNHLLIAVCNTRTDHFGCITRGYKGFSGGLFESVSLLVRSPLHVQRAFGFLNEDMSSMTWQADLSLITPASPVQLCWAIRDSRGRSLREGQVPITSSNPQWTIDVHDLDKWSDESPALYELRLALHDADHQLDHFTQSFGIRRLSVHNTSLHLNGSPVYLRGATEHAYFPLTTTPPRDKSTCRAWIRAMKNLGFNWLRFHTTMPPEPYMQAADELGMMIQVEMPVNHTRQHWIEAMLACRVHPSIVIYCEGNEQLLDEPKIDQLREWAAIQKQLVPDALFNPQEALRGIEYGWKLEDLGHDVITEPYRHNPRRLQLIKSFSDVIGQYSWGNLSYNPHTGDPREVDRRLESYQRPCLSHELTINDGYIDLDLEHRYDDSRITPALHATVRARLRELNLIHKAPLYFRNSARFQHLIHKHTLENARKCRLLAGYDMLGPINCHWHRTGYDCGLMNEFYELKPGLSADQIRQFNAPSVLLLDAPYQRNWSAGSTHHLDLLLSHYAPQPIESATLHCRLVDRRSHVHQQWQFSISHIAPGSLATIATLDIHVPDIPATALRIVAELTSPLLHLTNDWDFYAFPAPQSSPVSASDALIITNELDAAIIEKLHRGSRILLLAPSFFPSQQTQFNTGSAGRPNSTPATVIADHPLLHAFPHSGLCEWQFYSMLQQGHAVQFDSLNLPFDPIIEIVSSYKRPRKLTSLFEFSLGQGVLLVCTLALLDDDPAALYLRQLMVDYLLSSACHPVHSIAPASLLTLLASAPSTQTVQQTDQAFDANAQIPRKSTKK